MKILFASENYYPKVSGVPVVVKYLAEGLCKSGYDVALVTQKPQGTQEQELINEVKVRRFSIWRDWKHAYKGDINNYVNFIKDYNADVNIIECSECITTDLMLPHLRDVRGKIIFHAHGLSGFDNKFFAFKDNLKHTLGTTYNWFNSKIYFSWKFKKAFKYFESFICLSEVDSGIEYVKKYAKKYYILGNAADDMFFLKYIVDGSINKYTKLKCKRYMISCANYTVVKNQKDMIWQYFRSDSSKEYSLVCIGSQDNDYYKECMVLVSELEKQYGHRDVHLLHGVMRDDIPSIIKGASLYLVSSRWEQYSISIIEAMSLGIPFISTNVGNARLLPGGVTINNIEEMHIKIDKLIKDANLYKNYSDAGKMFAYENCRIDSVVNKLEIIIKTTINS
jgi:glycosyltransferase involved in cell wall biosynthesis